MCAQSARQIQSRPFWSGPCRLPYRRLDELMANKFSDGNIHLNYAKKTAQIGSYSAWWGPAVQIPSPPPSSPSISDLSENHSTFVRVWGISDQLMDPESGSGGAKAATTAKPIRPRFGWVHGYSLGLRIH